MEEMLAIPNGFHGWAWFCRGSAVPWAHRHRELECNLVLRGRAAYLLDDRRYHLRQHSMVWLFPGQNHQLVSCSDDLQLRVLVWKRALVATSCRQATNAVLRDHDPGGTWCRILPAATGTRLEREALRLGAGLDRDHHRAQLAWLLHECWQAYRRAQEVPAAGECHPALAGVIARLLEDPSCTLDKCAASVGVSASHLGRLFRQQLGITAVNWRNRVRLQRVDAALAADDPRDLLAIALDAGFGSYAQFHRVYRAAHGYPPSARR